MEKIVLFHPFVPQEAIEEVSNILNTRWIGQGPKVDEFEKQFKNHFTSNAECVAVGSGTDALHLAYICAGLKPGDEVITPVFTCTATNIPLLYMGVKIKFADVNPETLNIDIDHIKEIISDKTKAIVCVHYGGLPCDMTGLSRISKEYGIPIIQDSAHAIGAKFKGDHIADLTEFSCFSFQAIKSITTGDGGMLVLQNKDLVDKAKRIRWFGIDRDQKQRGVWENDIYEIGYKYQMTDIGAVMGIAALKSFTKHLEYRRTLFNYYQKVFRDISDVKFVNNDDPDYFHAAWLCTILVENRHELEKKLIANGIENGQVHYRNDRYSIFSEYKRNDLNNMNQIESNYLVLPMHSKIDKGDIDRIYDIIKSGW